MDGRAIPGIDRVDQAIRDLAAAAHAIPAPLSRDIAHTVTITPGPWWTRRGQTATDK